MMTGHDARTDEATPRLGRGRRATIRVLAVVALLTTCFLPLFAATDAYSRVGAEPVLEAPGSPEAEYGADHPSEDVHLPAFVAMVVIAASGLLGLVVNPERAGSATHAGAVAVAMLLVAGLVGDPDNHGGQGLLIDPVVVVAALPALATALVAVPWREWSRGGLRRPQFLFLATLALPALWFGIDQALLQRNTWPPLADPHHQTHWMVMAQLAFAIPLVTAGAALSGRGWRIATATTALGALAISIPSVIYRDAASAIPVGWAVAGLLWAMAAVALTWRIGAIPADPVP